MQPIQILSEAKDSISCVDVRQNGCDMAEIVTTSVDGNLRTYDLRLGQIRQDNLGKDVVLNCVASTSDGLCNVVSSLDGDIHILECSTGNSLKNFRGKHSAGRYSLQCNITADDNFIICGSENGDAVIYDFTTGQVVTTLQGHTRPTCSIACHPKSCFSSILITGSYDGRGVVWTNGNPDLVVLK